MAQEKNFENRVKKYLKEEGCYIIKHHGGYFSKAGIPDLLVSCNGRFLGIEIKADKGKPSELQIENIKDINKSGGIGLILHPSEFDLFKSMISKIINFKLNDASNIREKIMELRGYE